MVGNKGIVRVSGNDMGRLVAEVSGRGGNLSFIAGGTSMMPVICGGDRITLSPLHGVAPFRGEVVALVSPGTGGDRLLVHRVVDRRRDLFLVGGDNRRQPDGFFPLSGILGVVTGVERGGRKRYWPDRRKHPLWCRFYQRFSLLKAKCWFGLKRLAKLNHCQS